jgi:very-short-patch-repair endonuclease
MILTEEILKIITTKPGQKAKDIATILGVDKAVVNSVLYGPLRGKVVQDRAYRWWPIDHSRAERVQTETAPKLDTLLAKLSRYYLDCLSHDDIGGVSVWASSKYNDLSYVELKIHPQITEGDISLFEEDFAKKLLEKVRRNRSQLTLYLGYPTSLKKIRGKSGWEGFKVEPIFLLPLQEDPINRQSPPVLTEEILHINFEALKALTITGSSNVIGEAVQLQEELGLTNTEGDLPDLDEIIARLRSVRSEWAWKEEPDPYTLNQRPLLSQAEEPGIYNRAILVATERSPYTRGLETELVSLQSVEEHKYKDTALGAWLSGMALKSQPASPQPLLEVLPLNSEQRQAVLQGLHNPLTVITGPPGTGKSQVVTSLLINAAWQGKTVLFASKNNKAVEVVETRVNALGPSRILIRLGYDQQRDFRSELAVYLVSLLAASSLPEDEIKYQEYLQKHEDIRFRFNRLEALVKATLDIRNNIDQIEQEVEVIRGNLGHTLFNSFRNIEEKALRETAKTFCDTVYRSQRSKQNVLVQVLWQWFKKGRYIRLAEATNQLADIATHLGLAIPDLIPEDSTIEQWAIFARDLLDRVEIAAKVFNYFQQLDLLNFSTPFEQISQRYQTLVDELSDNSEDLWQTWLKLRPKRLTKEDKNLLSQYVSLLQLIMASTEERHTANKKIFAKYYDILPKITKILSCWAVSSLSARGRIPFEPGFFDLLVIDEASQCDIASVIPLLYRAKRAVIIGDPNQLSHISTLAENQDTQFLAKYGLIDDYASWAYSVNSLFKLASSFCDSTDIIDLRDHHRSHSDIIGFSNKEFYGGRLRIATNYDRLRFLKDSGPVVRWLDVPGQVLRHAGGSVYNEPEARAVVRELERVVLEQNYVGTIGVVSPFAPQAKRIHDMVFQHDQLARRIVDKEFLSATVNKFQGDERDLMIFSPVVSSGITKGALWFLHKYPNLFNVAITRARGALVVVGDRQAALNSGVDYFSRFAVYVCQIDSHRKAPDQEFFDYGPDYPSVAHPEKVSEWEKILYQVLYKAGLRPMPQYEVDKYYLDFALLNGQRRLDIEVDGEYYHRNWDGEHCRHDHIRTQRLIELGWDVMRFWVYQVRDDLQSCINRVRTWVKT